MERKRKGRNKTGWRRTCKSLLLVLLLAVYGFPGTVLAEEEELQLTSQAAVLMEASTGTVIYEKNPTEKLRPASITKIMTLILIFDALQDGRIHLEDEVVTSAHAKSMGGSQVFLEEGEIQTVETLIKCIVIASGNDASVAMAEHLAGSEEAFVRQMNERAAGLGMEQTHFEDCCGLTDSATHVSSARDVAIMSRELVTKYPQVYAYSTIWMENITHVTRQGSKEFCLTNTNKLLKSYEGIRGLKTGSTSLAKYCFSATAIRDGVHMIAVVMAAPDFRTRFREAAELLNYGYARTRLYEDPLSDVESISVPTKGSVKKQIEGTCQGSFTYLCMNGEDPAAITRDLQLEPFVTAPVQEGDPLGRLVYFWNGQEIGSVPVTAAEEVKRAGFSDYLWMLFREAAIL